MTNETKRTPAIEAGIDFPTPSVGRLCLTFSNGAQLEIRTDRISADISLQATLHGLKQKLVDAAAISRNPDTGRSATIDDKYAAVKEVFDRLMSGQWNKTREGGAPQGGLLFRALCILYPAKTPDALREFMASKTPTELAALRKVAKIAAIIDTLRAEASDVDGDALLDGLDD
jgi:hypothetical protein